MVVEIVSLAVAWSAIVLALLSQPAAALQSSQPRSRK